MCEGIGKSKSSYIHVLAIIITALCCIYIRALDSIFIFNGEFGYWAHVVSAIGYNWKELISTTPYYTWGYSIWLIPIIALLPTPLAWYKAVIFLNVLFLVLSFFLCYQSGRKLFCEADERLVALVSFIVIIYPSNIVYAQAAWTESLSYMLVWLETYLIMYFCETRVGLLIFGFSLIVGIGPIYYLITHAADGFNTICSSVIGVFYYAVF